MSRYECLEQVILIKSEQRAIYVTAPISDKCHFALSDNRLTGYTELEYSTQVSGCEKW